MKPIAMFLLALLLTTACRKQSRQLPGKADLKLPQATSIAMLQNLLPANPENPYDSAGIIHNRLLAGAQRYVLETGDTALLSVQDQVVSILQKQRPFDPQVLQAVSPAFQRKVLGQAGKVPELSGLSSPMQQYARQLFTLMTNSRDLNYSRIKAGIVALEKEIIADPALKDQEYKTLLQTTAIARYSVHYWINWAGSAEGQKVLYRGYNSPASVAVAVMAMYNADCLAMWYCYAWGLVQDPNVTAEDILLLVSGVSTAAFIMTLNAT